jgi:hypothetical protein
VTVEVRDDLVEAHRLAWEHVAAPGSWFTGAQRIELAGTVLVAIANPDPVPPWIGVTTTDRLPPGRIAPDAAHDVAYRLARHAGTMTEDVYRRAASVLGELPYVELCAVVSTVAAVAHFHRDVGRTVPPLPAAVAGDPTGERPEELVVARLNWVPVAAPADEVAAVVQAYSAVPAEWVNTWRMADAQYMPEPEMVHPDWSRRPGGMTRAQMELVAATISRARECFY